MCKRTVFSRSGTGSEIHEFRRVGNMTAGHLTLVTIGALVLFGATGLGAYGTHAVQGAVDAAQWSAFETAVDYQFYHGLGMVGARRDPPHPPCGRHGRGC